MQAQNPCSLYVRTATCSRGSSCCHACCRQEIGDRDGDEALVSWGSWLAPRSCIVCGVSPSRSDQQQEARSQFAAVHTLTRTCLLLYAQDVSKIDMRCSILGGRAELGTPCLIVGGGQEIGRHATHESRLTYAPLVCVDSGLIHRCQQQHASVGGTHGHAWASAPVSEPAIQLPMQESCPCIHAYLHRQLPACSEDNPCPL